MKKDQILSYVTPSFPFHSTLDLLVSRQASVEAIDAEIAQAKREAAGARSAASRCHKALMIPVGVLVLAAASNYLGYGSLVVYGLVTVLALALAILFSHLGHHFQRTECFCGNTIAMLQPISGTNACAEALQYLEADAPGVAAWRDIAISEREQLYHFDVSVMRRLHVREEHRSKAGRKVQDASERQRLNDEACRKVHDVTPRVRDVANLHSGTSTQQPGSPKTENAHV